MEASRSLERFATCASFALAVALAPDGASAQCAASQGHLSPQLANGDFGVFCALSGATLAVAKSKSVDVYQRTGAMWTLQASSLATPGGNFVSGIALDADTLLVASSLYSAEEGGVRVYQRSGGSWAFQQDLVASDGQTSDHFGSAVALRGDRAVIGARDDDDYGNYSGSVYVFARVGTTWTEEQKLNSTMAGTNEQLGYSVEYDGERIIVGGALRVCIFARPSTTWVQEAMFTPGAHSVSIEGPVAAARYWGACSSSPRIVAFDGATWTHSAWLPAWGDGRVRLANGRLAASNVENTLCSTHWGDVNLYDLTSGGWALTGSLQPSATTSNALFGMGLDFEGTTLVVGAPHNDFGATDAGSTEIFFVAKSPATYCTAKTNSLGCTPAMASTGIPSASSGSGFIVKATNTINGKSGLLMYGFSGRAAVPFQGGTLCIALPLRRALVVGSGGTPPPAQDCTGVLALDMNAFAAGQLGGSPDPALRIAGTQVDSQWWARDPGYPSPNNSQLSNGLEWFVCL
jgi:hypothetical protein